MPTPANISIEGSAQGDITQGAFTDASAGNIWQEGQEDEILVQAIDHRVTIPRELQIDVSARLTSTFPVYSYRSYPTSVEVHQKYGPSYSKEIDRIAKFDDTTNDVVISNGKAKITLKPSGEIIISGSKIIQIADDGLIVSAAYIDLN